MLVDADGTWRDAQRRHHHAVAPDRRCRGPDVVSGRMARIFVEGWSPGVRRARSTRPNSRPPRARSTTPSRPTDWAPRDGIDDGCERIAFVDGVRRIDARLTVDDPVAGPVPGICGTFAIGAVLWDRRGGPLGGRRRTGAAVGRARRRSRGAVPRGRSDAAVRDDDDRDRDGDALVHALQSTDARGRGLARDVARRRSMRLRRRPAERARPARGRRRREEPPRDLPRAGAQRG